MRKICLISCVSKKAPNKAQARELYVSDLFEKGRAYAESRFDEWYILSAEYCLLHPDQIIAPYERTLNKMSKDARREWADLAYASIVSKVAPGSYIAFLAGERYRENLAGKLAESGYKVRIPLEGLRIGMQLSWLKKIQHDHDRLRHLDQFYGLLTKLEKGLGGRRALRACTGAMNWPKIGVYFFFEPDEFRTSDVVLDRVCNI